MTKDTTGLEFQLQETIVSFNVHIPLVFMAPPQHLENCVFERVRLSCVQQRCSGVIWENWCVKSLVVAFHFRVGVTVQLTACLFTRTSPAAMVTRFYQPPRAEPCAIKAYSIL